MQFVVWYHGKDDLDSVSIESVLPNTAHVIFHDTDRFLIEAECESVLRKALQPEKDWEFYPDQSTHAS